MTSSSFSAHSYLHLDACARVCQALNACPLRELAIGDLPVDGHDSIFTPASEVFSLCGLERIHVTALCMDRVYHSGPGLSLHLPHLIDLLHRSPQLEHLKVESSHGNPMQWTMAALNSLEEMKNLRSLDLQDVELQDGSDKELLRLLATFKKLQRLRLIQNLGPITTLTGATEATSAEGVSLASLRDVEISCERFLKTVLSASRPDVVRLLRIPRGEIGSVGSVLLQSNSVKEVHLCFVKKQQYTEDEVGAMIQSLPLSVERVAIYTSSRLGPDCLKHLNRLLNLKRIILPLTIILHNQDRFGVMEGANRRVDSRATRTASLVCTPKLEYVFFQEHDSGRYPYTYDWIGEYGSFCEKEDRAERFAVKVERYARGATSESEPLTLKRQLAYGSSSSFSTWSHETQVRAEVVGAKCLCASCWVKKNDTDCPERCMYHDRPTHWSHGQVSRRKANLLL